VRGAHRLERELAERAHAGGERTEAVDAQQHAGRQARQVADGDATLAAPPLRGRLPARSCGLLRREQRAQADVQLACKGQLAAVAQAAAGLPCLAERGGLVARRGAFQRVRLGGRRAAGLQPLGWAAGGGAAG
jgi:hypothetical protein